MARPLRYEEAGEVYHLMPRGDGGKNVFEEDKNCFAWTDLLEKAHERFGWRVHAWVLMGNHFHLLLETPEPNLVARAKDRKGVVSDEALVELLRGWYLGEPTFGEKVLESIKAVGGPRKKSSVGGGRGQSA